MTAPTGQPGISQMFRGLVKSVMADEFGSIPGEVLKYDHTTQLADVQPLFKFFVDGVLAEPKVCRDVPVLWPGAGDVALTFPLKSGDVVDLLVQMCDISKWVASGTKHDAVADKRRFSLSDVVALPRLRSRSSPLPSSCVHADDPVLSGNPVRVGDSSADKSPARDTDPVHKLNAPPDALAVWMTQVETFINGLVLGTVSPLSTTFTQVGTIQSTATKVLVK